MPSSQRIDTSFKHHVLTALSLLPTPLLLFISSSSDIYLRNQSLLQYQHAVLVPFVKLFLLTLLLGAALAVISRHFRALRFVLCTYYLIGPFFLLFAFVRGHRLPLLELLSDTTAGLLLWPVLLLIASSILSRRLSSQVVQGLAAFGVALLAYEGLTLVHNISGSRRPTESAKPSPPPATAPDELPNVYHLIFDAYQTDLFEQTVTPETEAALGGFVYFPENTAVVAYTPMSLASVLSGRRYFYDRSRADYMRAAFKSKASLLHWLKSQGYQTFAYVTNAWQNRDGFFDHMFRHGDSALDELLALNTEAFWNLWLYSTLPTPIRDKVMRTGWFSQLNEEDLKQLGDRRLLPYSAPVTSYLGFQKLMADEATLPAAGRYTLVHVVIPHHPLKLQADCSYSVGSSTTGVIQQSQCALTLIIEFVALLKQLGRFEDSLILIHGDHGGPYRTRNDAIVTGARSRSLHTVLLVKPVGVGDDVTLQVLDTEMSLLDVPSIVMSSVVDTRLGRNTTQPWNRPRAVVPFIEGELIESAELIVKRNGFAIGELKEIHSERDPEGTVISQDPPAYRSGQDTEKIDVVVSLGPSQAADIMPDFVGRDVSEASAWLGRTPHASASIRRVAHAGAPEGMVVRQTPRAGTRTDKNQEVVFYVSRGN